MSATHSVTATPTPITPLTQAPRIAVGGWQHETNTFAPQVATWQAFEQADAWPGLSVGELILERFQQQNIPLTGFIKACPEHWQLLPTLWCSATPCGLVTQTAFDALLAELLNRLRKLQPLDAVYLDLHGAMVAEHHADADGEILTQVRTVIGTHCKLIASLDLHANISQTMVDAADMLVSYQTYPHVDMATTGARTAKLLNTLLQSSSRPSARLDHLPFLIPMTAQCTLVEPMLSLLHDINSDIATHKLLHQQFTTGFPLADVHECGPALLSYDWDPQRLHHHAESRLKHILNLQNQFNSPTYAPKDGVAMALAHIQANPTACVVLADTQDNPGCGGSSDGIGLLAELLHQQAKGVLLGVLLDPAAASICHNAGVGHQLPLRLGGRLANIGEQPLAVEATVLALGDGRFTGTGPFYAGCNFELGPMALLDIDGIHVVLSSVAQQAADQAMFKHVGANPVDYRILALKSSVHFRADFQALATAILVVTAPGANTANPADLHYQHLRPGVAL